MMKLAVSFLGIKNDVQEENLKEEKTENNDIENN